MKPVIFPIRTTTLYPLKYLYNLSWTQNAQQALK